LPSENPSLLCGNLRDISSSEVGGFAKLEETVLEVAVIICNPVESVLQESPPPHLIMVELSGQLFCLSLFKEGFSLGNLEKSSELTTAVKAVNLRDQRSARGLYRAKISVYPGYSLNFWFPSFSFPHRSE
jgi:hypothetical protein